METKLYRAGNQSILDQIRKITISAQMHNLQDLQDLEIYGKLFLVKVKSEKNSYNYDSIKKEFIIISNTVGNAIAAFIDSNERYYFIPPRIISKIEAFELDTIVDISKRIGM